LFTSWSLGVGRGHNRENYIYISLHRKKSSSPEPVGQFQSKLGINHPWVKGILNCSNKRLGPLQRGDNLKNEVGSFKNLLQNH
jgi:hypothetical protein